MAVFTQLWGGQQADWNAPGQQALSITPNDSTDLTGGIVRSLYIGVAGDVRVMMADDTVAVTFTNVAAGIFPIAVKRVYATGTTATGIIGLR